MFWKCRTQRDVDRCISCGASLDGAEEVKNLYRIENVSTKRAERITANEEERVRHVAGVAAPLEPAHQAAGGPRELPGHQLGQRRHLVGDRGRGDHQVVAVGVLATAVVVEGHQPGRAERDVGLTVAPRTPRGVADHTLPVVCLISAARQYSRGGRRICRRNYSKTRK